MHSLEEGFEEENSLVMRWIAFITKLSQLSLFN